MTTNDLHIETTKLCHTILFSNEDYNGRSDSLDAWDGLRPWLAKKGYQLYLRHENGKYWYPQHDIETEPDLYFPEIGGQCHVDQCFKHHPLETTFKDRVGFAQSSSFHHICLKLMLSASVEHRILRFLYENREEAMSNCVMPALDFLDVGEYSFAIMPRWGDRIELPWFSSVREAASFIRDILKAYCYLHKHHIVYQDIKLGNILLSHFFSCDGLGYCLQFNSKRIAMKENNCMRYALCDFDFSMMLTPPSGKTLRLPAKLSFHVAQFKPYDTIQGEPDYNPLAFDIGCLGIFLWHLFGNNIENFPLVVPLIDRMITWRLEERFTASEAFRFVEDNMLNGSISLLNRRLDPCDHYHSMSWDPGSNDKWANLPTGFVETWGMYKAPKSKFRDRILRKLCVNIYGAYTTVKFFRTLYKHFKTKSMSKRVP